MASTIDNVIATIRDADILPETQVNYGITDGLQPPYLNMMNYAHTYEYQTGGVASSIKHSTWDIVITDVTQEGAESLAEQVDAILNCQEDVTPTTSGQGCLQTNYQVGQTDTKLYQFAVMMSYELYEG